MICAAIPMKALSGIYVPTPHHMLLAQVLLILTPVLCEYAYMTFIVGRFVRTSNTAL